VRTIRLTKALTTALTTVLMKAMSVVFVDFGAYYDALARDALAPFRAPADP
jgi:hypothetical protein